MPVRTRRVRWLAVAVCIAIVFFLYERNTAQVDRYLSPTAVGGGAVLRKEDATTAGPPPPPNPQPRPQLQPQEALVEPKPDLKPPPIQKPQLETAESISTKEDSAADTTGPPSSSTTSSTKAPLPTLPPKVQNTIDDDDWTDPGLLFDDEYDSSSSAPYSAQHWRKFPETFPVTSTIQLPTANPSAIPRIQTAKRGAHVERLAAVKEATKHAWKGYRDNGWGFDEVLPVSGVGKNSFNGWGATLVDSLDTLWIMDMKDEFEDAVNQTSHIDFTTSSRADIPLFEVTIRYLGGLIAAYDVSEHKYRVLLDKAVELAEILYSAFDTPNRMPETYYHWKPTFASNPHRASNRVVLAELGTLSLEFTRLAQLTKEPKYYDAIARITDAFDEWQNQTRIPGMWPIAVDASGCAKPTQLPSSSTYRQQPFGNGYMMTSEPMHADRETMDKAATALKNRKGTGSGKLGQPEASFDAGMYATSAEGIDEDLDEDLDEVGSSTSHSVYEGPTRESKLEGLNKRQLEDEDEEEDTDLVDPRVKYGRPAKAIPIDAGLAKPAFYEGDTNSYAPIDTKSKEPECIPQGLRSPSKTGWESFTMGGQSDSLYEYLPKEYLLLGGVMDQYKRMYLTSMEPTIEKLLFRPMTLDNLDILISGEVMSQYNYTSGEFYETHNPKGEHLTCFVGGMLAMGGKIFNRPDHVEYGRKVTDGCIWSYNSTTSGIMPESFFAAPCKDRENCKWNQTAYWEALDPNWQHRDDQRADWIKRYGQEAFDNWNTKPVDRDTPRPFNQPSMRGGPVRKPAGESNHMPERLVYSDGSGAAKTKPADHRLENDDATNGHVKRQAVDPSEYKRPSAGDPKPPQSAKFPATGAKASSFADDSVSPPSFDTPSTTTTGDLDESDNKEDYEPAQAIYTPAPPLTHEEYVKEKIADDRLPPGMTRFDSSKYILRPEAIESVFYMYRITGEQHWRDAGWEMFQAVERATRTEFGHSAIDDVSRRNPRHLDGMESFWLAETLKYFYLLFDDEDKWSLDDWVLNTEAHFFRRPENPSV